MVLTMYPLLGITWVITLRCLAAENSENDFQNTFMENCANLKRQRPHLTQAVPRCCELWEDFSKPFLYQKFNLAGNRFNYVSYIQKAGHPIPENKAMFWSKVRLNPGNRFLSASDTILGYPMQNDIWCGQKTSPGYHLLKSGSYTNATLAYWKQASKEFASQATGNVSLMLNGLRTPVFQTDSIFATNELPQMYPPRVLSLRVYVVSRRGKTVTERCGQGSLVDLSSLIERQGLQYTCVDDYDKVKRELCEDKEPCWTLSSVSGTSP